MAVPKKLNDKALAAQAAVDQARDLLRNDPALAQDKEFVRSLRALEKAQKDYLDAQGWGASTGATLAATTLALAGRRALTTPNPYVMLAGLLILAMTSTGTGGAAEMMYEARLDLAMRAMVNANTVRAGAQLAQEVIEAARKLLNMIAAQYAVLAVAAAAVAAEVTAAEEELAKAAGRIAAGSFGLAISGLRQRMEDLIRRIPPGGPCSDLVAAYRTMFARMNNAVIGRDTSIIMRAWRNLKAAAQALIDCMRGQGGGGGGSTGAAAG